MTLLMASQADDGAAAVSDRKEDRPDKEVTKCHMVDSGRFHIALAGDGKAARGLLRKVAEGRTVQATVIEKRICDLAASIYDQGQAHVKVGGRKEYGFGLAVFGRGGAELHERCTAEMGTLEILFRIGPAAGQAGTGKERGQAHG